MSCDSSHYVQLVHGLHSATFPQLQTNVESLWFASGFQATFTRTLLCTRFNRSPIARAFGLTCIRIQGLVMLYFYTARLPSSFGSFGADSPTRTDNRLITNQLRYRLRHICSYNWSEGRESNPQMLAWKARAKPLGYPRIKELNSEFWKKIIKEYTRTQK